MSIERCSVFTAVGLIAATLMILPSTAYAQAVAAAQVTGLVTDPSGAAVAGATVNMVETERGVAHTTTTDTTGRYTLPNLPVGPYRLEASLSGFKSFVQSGIVLQVGEHVQVNVALQVGAVSESIEVKAGAAMVQTAQNSVSQVIDERRMTELPLNGRQATQLVLISGAAVAAAPPNQDITSSKSFYSGVTISVAGGQANGTNYLLDGGDNRETLSNVNLPFPFPDALQEFSVETSALPARNGTQPGGVVNVVSKSGSNQLHGNVFEFLRNGNVNARNFFAPMHDTLKRNQFGGTLGGRIIRDRLFFFGGYQGTRNRQNPPQTISYVPTPAALSGDFSGLESGACQSSGKVRTINDPLTRQPFPNAQVPVSRFDPAAVKLTNYLPAAGNQCGKVTYGIPTTGDEDQIIGRVDWAKSSKHSFFGRYFVVDYRNPASWNPKNLLITTLPGNLERSQSITLGDTYTFSPSTLNAFHATFTRVRNNRSTNPNDINPTVLGVKIFPNVPNDIYVTVSNAFALGCNTCSPGHFNVNTFQFADDVDVIRGKHQMAFGVDYIRTQNNLLSGASQNGSFVFSGSASGDSMVDFLLGVMSGSGAQSGFTQTRTQEEALRQTVPALYAQDTIRVNSRLLVNAGLRWEPMLFPTDLRHRGSTFSLPAFLAGQKSPLYTNSPAGSFYYGDPGVPPGFTKDKLTNFSPRLGLVVDPKGDGRQTIRVGAALMYDSAMVFFPQRMMSNPPFGYEIQLPTSAPGGFSDPWGTGYRYPGGNPFPLPTPPPRDIAFPLSPLRILMPESIKPMSVAQWNISYQRQISANWLASVSYLGNKTSHLWTNQEINPAVYIPGTCGSGPCSTTSNTPQRKLLYRLNAIQGQYYGNTVLAFDGANANYNAVLTSVQHRFSRGFTLLANYTWSHCISDADFRGDITSPAFSNPSNLHADRGNCAFDVRHIFNLSVVATSPIKGNTWKARLLGKWQIAPLARAIGGQPLNVVTGKDNSLIGVNLDRPNLVQPNAYSERLGPTLQHLNPSSFAPNALGTFGNLGRNTVRGPGQFNFDLALSRIFALSEKLRLEVRGEAFNAINHTNFSPTLVPSTGISTNSSVNVSSATFGRIVGAADPRIWQFAMKLAF